MMPKNLRYWAKLVLWLLLSMIGVHILLQLNNLGDTATASWQPKRVLSVAHANTKAVVGKEPLGLRHLTLS